MISLFAGKAKVDRYDDCGAGSVDTGRVVLSIEASDAMRFADLQGYLSAPIQWGLQDRR